MIAASANQIARQGNTLLKHGSGSVSWRLPGSSFGLCPWPACSTCSACRRRSRQVDSTWRIIRQAFGSNRIKCLWCCARFCFATCSFLALEGVCLKSVWQKSVCYFFAPYCGVPDRQGLAPDMACSHETTDPVRLPSTVLKRQEGSFGEGGKRPPSWHWGTLLKPSKSDLERGEADPAKPNRTNGLVCKH